MIDTTQYQRILDSGLLLDHYLLLITIRDGGDIIENRRIQGFLNLLNKKGYIEDGILTDSAILLIEGATLKLDPVTITTTTTMKPGEFNFDEWVMGVHKACQERIRELTGKVQVRGKVNGKSYPFLCNSIDMNKVLRKIILLYKLKDYSTIERCIFQHIDKCSRANHWFPLMKYYIFKDGQSDLVTDLGDLEDNTDQQGPKSTQKFV
jgi:hypothetical protein